LESGDAHVVRACGEGGDLLLHRRVKYPRPDAGLLLRIRRGELPYAQVALLEAGRDWLEACNKRSMIPASPDHCRAEALVRDVFLGVVNAPSRP
jgi:hypothetical protein